MINEFVPDGAKWYTVEQNENCSGLDIEFYGDVTLPAGLTYYPVSNLTHDLSARDVVQIMRERRIVPTGGAQTRNKYSREIKPGVFVDVYDVLRAFNVTCGAIAHAIKKLLAAGQRGHKDQRQDYVEARDSTDRAIEQLDEWA